MSFHPSIPPSFHPATYPCMYSAIPLSVLSTNLQTDRELVDGGMDSDLRTENKWRDRDRIEDEWVNGQIALRIKKKDGVTDR